MLPGIYLFSCAYILTVLYLYIFNCEKCFVNKRYLFA